MFLKRIEMQGFKSFADKTVLELENAVTGVVGPNGCGKSNISDAIKWVLGEKSAKTLRATDMTDVVFSGAEGRGALNFAEVTLVIDNSSRILNIDKDDIEITRRIYKEENEAQYLINRQQVRLKDVTDLILDTGLGKDSLSLVSQGNITEFADAKSYDRRNIFEEAAGVAKYKKRKIESIAKLERTKDNLDRTYDIIQELEKQVNPLKRQAKKAEIYREKKKRLEEIEIAVIVDEITSLTKQKDELSKAKFDLESNQALHRTSVEVNDNKVGELKTNLNNIDKEITSLQEKLEKTMDEITILEKKKVEINEKRKYKIEVGSSEEKIKELKKQMDEAKFEYDERLNRQNELLNEKELLNSNLEELSIKLAEASLNKEEKTNLLNKIDNRISILENLIKDPFASSSHSGVKAIMDNKQSFYGVLGVVGQEIKPMENYDYAISAALGNSTYHIVCKDEESAKGSISFLKKNESGRATFLPLTVLKEKDIKYDDQIICKNTPGYIGVCCDFVTCDEVYDPVVFALLGNILVCDNLDSATNLAGLLKYNYKIVTLDGEIIHKGGSITGGKVKNETSIVTVQSELEKNKSNRMSFAADLELASKEYDSFVENKKKLDERITENRINLAQVEPLVEVKRSRYESCKNDYELANPENKNVETAEDNDLVSSLTEAQNLKETLTTTIKLKREERIRMNNEITRSEMQTKQMRGLMDQDNGQLLEISQNEAVINTKLDNNLARLTSEYRMTFEYAKEHNTYQIVGNEREEVASLRNEISNLGNVNMAAPEEFTEINERYEFLKHNYDDLIESRNKILDAIDEMDEIMKLQFVETFNAINKELPNTFKFFFGGGRARLILEDENDVLNCGIDIDVQPPGKVIKSIRLFSGGEKALISMCVLFTILKIKPIPLVVFDEIDSPLDQLNVERFAKYVNTFSTDTQFIIITHRPGTMEQCGVLYGVTMQKRGISQLLKVKLVDAIEMADKHPEAQQPAA